MYVESMTRQEAADWAAYLADKPEVTGKPLSDQERNDLSDCKARVAELDAIARQAERN